MKTGKTISTLTAKLAILIVLASLWSAFVISEFYLPRGEGLAKFPSGSYAMGYEKFHPFEIDPTDGIFSATEDIVIGLICPLLLAFGIVSLLIGRHVS